MNDTPRVTSSGAGTRREAARIGQSIGDSVAAAAAGYGRPLHLAALRLQLPAGATKEQIDQAVRLALARQARGAGR